MFGGRSPSAPPLPSPKTVAVNFVFNLAQGLIMRPRPTAIADAAMIINMPIIILIIYFYNN